MPVSRGIVSIFHPLHHFFHGHEMVVKKSQAKLRRRLLSSLKDFVSPVQGEISRQVERPYEKKGQI